MNSGITGNDSLNKFYIGTVCLEKNRWGTRIPSFKVSDWAGRFTADGFDGIELWENHYLLADEAEQKALCALKLPLVYNSYVGFADDEKDARTKAVRAINQLKPLALKYNLGKNTEKLEEYRRNLLSWADEVPMDCKLLCECHAGTVLENPGIAAEFHRNLDGERFGIIIHPIVDPDLLRKWLDVFGGRVRELHLQFRTPESDPSTNSDQEHLAACALILKEHRFNGVATIEFTRGIGREEKINEIYANACSDMRKCREIFRKN